jgi:hypothetical protein
VLAHVPSERSFLDAQGLVIFAMACVTGFAVAVAGSGWWNIPITHILWLGVIWTAVICIVDRLIYKSFRAAGRTWRWRSRARRFPSCSRSSSACRWCSSSSSRRSRTS